MYAACVGNLVTLGAGDVETVLSMDNPEQFQSQKQLKETMESGIQL